MAVYNSGDVSLERASFSDSTAGSVRLPLASPAHARSHAIATARSGRRRQRDIGVANGGHAFPKGSLWASAFSRSLTPSPLFLPAPIRAVRRRYVRGEQRRRLARAVQRCPLHDFRSGAARPLPQEGAQTETGDQTVFFCRRIISLASVA